MTLYVINALSIPLYGIWIKNRKLLTFVISTQLFLILALRAETLGDDLGNYVLFYDSYQNYSFWELLQAFRFPLRMKINYGQESGYVLVNWIIGRLGFSFHSYLVFHAAFCMTAVSLFLYRNADNISLGYLFFLAFGYGYFFSGLRHSLGVAMFLLSLSALKEKRFGKYCAYTVAAALFHVSFLLMLPLWFFTKIKPTRRGSVVIAAISILLLAAMPILAEAVVRPIISGLRGDVYLPQFEWNNLYFLILALFLAAAFLCGSNQQDWRTGDGVLYASLGMALLLQTVCFYVTAISRFVIGVFLPAGLVFFGNALRNYRDRRVALALKAVVYVFVIAFYLWTLKDEYIVPYISIFD